MEYLRVISMDRNIKYGYKSSSRLDIILHCEK